MQTILRQPVQLLASNPDILQGPRHTQFADHGVQHVAQICRGDVHASTMQDVGDDGVRDEEFSDEFLAGDVGVVRGVVFAYGWEKDTACFAVADANGTELYN